MTIETTVLDRIIATANEAYTCHNPEIAVHVDVLVDIAHRAYLVQHTHPSRLADKTAKLAKFESVARDGWRAARDKLIGDRPSGPAKKKKKK